MKFVYKTTLMGLALGMSFLASCKDDDHGVPGGFTVDKEEIAIGPDGGIEKIAVTADFDWVATTSRPWIFVSPANGNGSADCRLAIDSTLENTARTAQIRFSQEGQALKLITVTQFGFGKQILLSEERVDIKNSGSVGYDKRFFTSTISTNIHFKIDRIDYSFAEEASMTDEEKEAVESDRAGWVTAPLQKDLEVDLDRGARPRTLKARFRWEANTAPYTRVAQIRLVPVNADDELTDNDGNPTDAVVLTVTQEAAPKIEDNRAGDSLAVVIINAKLQSMIEFETGSNMTTWENVTLWEATDEGKGLPCKEAVGRIRSVKFMMFDLRAGEQLPKEIRYLKYLESFTLQTNANWQLREVKLGNEICHLEYLKNISVFAVGIKELPEDFCELGSHLEFLSLPSNNFSSFSSIINDDWINETSFPKLRVLNLTGCRRSDTLKDLSLITAGGTYNGTPVGLHANISQGAEKNAFLRLLAWENLYELGMSYNFIEGELPTDDEVDAYLQSRGLPTRYTMNDFSENEEEWRDKLVGDTCRWLHPYTSPNPVTYCKSKDEPVYEYVTGQDVPRVLPHARAFYFNLNFLTGGLPKWVLFHPYFAYWNPAIFVFEQERGFNSLGEETKLDNIDADKFDYTYYYGNQKSDSPFVQGVAYPLYYKVFVAN